MVKSLIIVLYFIAPTLFANNWPTVECRFTSYGEEGDAQLRAIVSYSLSPDASITGGFLPYGFDLSVVDNFFVVGIYLGEEPLSSTKIPLANIVNLPLGATIFGVNTVYHSTTDGSVALYYECRKAQ